MNKRIFISLGLLALLLVVVIPFWAFRKDGSEDVPASDEAARQLFQTNCGSCHALAEAGTDGVVGPDLDVRLAAAGPAADADAVEATQQRVMTAIEEGVSGAMPAGILQGANAELVANYVARVAGQ